MKKSLLSVTAIILLAISCEPKERGDTDAGMKPNILFVFIDDMGYGDLGCYGNTEVVTPNIDQLAFEGLRFKQFYVNAPICSPSRVGVTTGQYPTRWGISSFIANRAKNLERGVRDHLDINAPTLARSLSNAGYYTAHIGKWHMGGGRDIGDVPYITEYGFDESVTQFEGIGERYLATYETLNLKDSTRDLEKMSAALGKGEIHWIKRYDFTEVFVDRTLQAIMNAENAGKPFYINLWPDDVHTPVEPPPALRGDGTTHEKYIGVINELDIQLGRLFDYIKNEPDLANNTLIIVTSDNGPARNVGSSGGLRGEKTNLYEGGIREPFIVWAPGYMSTNMKGAVNATTVLAGIDLAPSLIEIAGARKPANTHFDGLDMSQFLLGYLNEKRTDPVMWQRPPESTGTGRGENYPDLAIRDGDFKLLMDTDGSNPQLYNIMEDEKETVNLAMTLPSKVLELKLKLLNWYKMMPPMVQMD